MLYGIYRTRNGTLTDFLGVDSSKSDAIDMLKQMYPNMRQNKSFGFYSDSRNTYELRIKQIINFRVLGKPKCLYGVITDNIRNISLVGLFHSEENAQARLQELKVENPNSRFWLETYDMVNNKCPRITPEFGYGLSARR